MRVPRFWVEMPRDALRVRKPRKSTAAASTPLFTALCPWLLFSYFSPVRLFPVLKIWFLVALPRRYLTLLDPKSLHARSFRFRSRVLDFPTLTRGFVNFCFTSNDSSFRRATAKSGFLCDWQILRRRYVQPRIPSRAQSQLTEKMMSHDHL